MDLSCEHSLRSVTREEPLPARKVPGQSSPLKRQAEQLCWRGLFPLAPIETSPRIRPPRARGTSLATARCLVSQHGPSPRLVRPGTAALVHAEAPVLGHQKSHTHDTGGCFWGRRRPLTYSIAGGRRRGGVAAWRRLAIRRRRFVHLLTHFFANFFNRGAETAADIIPIDYVALTGVRPEMIDNKDDQDGQSHSRHHT